MRSPHRVLPDRVRLNWPLLHDACTHSDEAVTFEIKQQVRDAARGRATNRRERELLIEWLSLAFAEVAFEVQSRAVREEWPTA